jgi:hypothetical protein
MGWSGRSGSRKISLLLTCSILSASCGTSVLVRPDDAAFWSAQDHLAAITSRLEAAAVPPPERVLFLQAEALYRYRFEPPRRGTLSYLAQGAAAVTDFPAFQALAGSLDLADLRLRMYDGSVQLWETLLQRHPRSTLRPLTLYRLGWAYRSAGASGLPRRSGNDAFDALASEAPGTPLAALAALARSTPSKSKSTATGLSLVPGLGQMYVGEPLNGVVRLAVALAAVALVAVPVVIAYDRRQDLGWRRDWPLLATGLGGLVLLSMDYTSAYQDALRGVVDFNERAEARFESGHPDAP